MSDRTPTPPVPPPHRRLVAVLALAAALASCGGGGGDRPGGGSAGGAWSVFESGEGRFRVALPERPDRQEQAIDDGDLETRAVRFSSRLGDDATMDVSFADYPESIAEVDPRVVLAGAVAGAVERVEGTLAAQAPLTAEGSPAVDYLIEDGEGWLQARAILVGNRLYLLQLAAPRRDPDAFERLVTSFDLLERT